MFWKTRYYFIFILFGPSDVTCHKKPWVPWSVSVQDRLKRHSDKPRKIRRSWELRPTIRHTFHSVWPHVQRWESMLKCTPKTCHLSRNYICYFSSIQPGATQWMREGWWAKRMRHYPQFILSLSLLSPPLTHKCMDATLLPIDMIEGHSIFVAYLGNFSNLLSLSFVQDLIPHI